MWRPDDVENARRSVFRYLNGSVVPNPSTRRELAQALGVPAVALEDDPGDEESAQLARDLTAALRLLVAEQVGKAMNERNVA